MKTRSIFVATLLLVALASQADELPTGQWKGIKSSLHDLITTGYNVVAVTHETHAAGASTETVFLQKNRSLCKCIEFQISGTKTQDSIAQFMCLELVQPRSR